MSWHIVIAGGGFGGFYAARTLERVLPAQSTRVTLINDANFMLYTPLLPGAAGAALDPRHVVVPLRSQLRRTDLVIGAVTGADPDRHTLSVRRIDQQQLQIGYDQLIVALGSVSRTLPIPGLSEYAIGFKSLSDATALRNQVLGCLDIASLQRIPALREQYLGFVFVGAGYAGVEGLAELQDFAAQVIDLYPRCRAQGMRWVLAEAQQQIMQEVPPALSQFASRELRGRGIEVRTATTLTEITDHSATLSDGQVIKTRTVVWTAGVKPSPVVCALGFPLDGGGRIVVDRTMRVAGNPRAWAIGDCAAVPDPQDVTDPVHPPPNMRFDRDAALLRTSPPCSATGGCAHFAIAPPALSQSSVTTRLWLSRWGCAGVACRLGLSPAPITYCSCPASDASCDCWWTGTWRCCLAATLLHRDAWEVPLPSGHDPLAAYPVSRDVDRR